MSEIAKNCLNCAYLKDDGDPGEYGSPGYSYLVCDKRPNIENLKSFPFKKEQACFQLSFWQSEFTDNLDCCEYIENYNEQYDLYEKKYGNSSEKSN